VLFSGIPRIRLIDGPTPLERLTRFGKACGHEHLYIKRDDVMSLGLGGNKVRNIEFWLGEALAQKADVVVTAGGPFSSRSRLVASACAKIGIECHVLYGTDELPDLNANYLLVSLTGAKCLCLGKVTEEERSALTRSYAEELKKKGRRPYIAGLTIPGALGYVEAALELHAQAWQMDLDIRHIVVAGSMGPTEGGLLWGSALLGGAFILHCPSVEFKADKLRSCVLDVCKGISDRLEMEPSVPPERLLQVYGDFLGDGYDVPTEESVEAIRMLASLEGIFIENTYNGKVFAALATLLRSRILPPDEGVCVVHTGGIPALFGQGERFAAPVRHS
jgi:1-aminocyclopropane-1-carboxylate deaminase/D-cysteine desulfhydrase-like pyridoxal-dependent ACC family enzyme